jgi:4-carboxymuconolactone decarboxylase
MKQIATSLLILSSGALGAEAQDRPASRVAPDAVYKVAPPLGAYTDEVLFGDVWERPDLSPRDRSLVTVATLIATGRTAQVCGHVERALTNGVTPEEISELVTHLAFYAGWPNAISAVAEIEQVFDARGAVVAIDAEAAPLDLDPQAEAARATTVARMVAPIAPELARATDEVLFADLWRRPGLAARDRSLVTMSALIAAGQAEQLGFHLNRAMDNGLTRAQAAEATYQIAYYAGWPRAMSAITVIAATFAAREAEAQPTIVRASLGVIRGETAKTMAGPAETFTGAVRVGPLFAAEAPARLGGALVSFEAGARTAWHTHPLGQTLYVTEGCGWAQSEGEPVQEIRPGDIVQIPANVRHWHGASAEAAMSHVAIAESLDGSAVTWMELVADKDYARGADAAGACSAG